MSNLKPTKRTWGFRFSPTDAAAIAIFAGGAVACWRWHNPLWWMLLMVAGHFFLFCNVFRISRRRELIWAGVFVLNMGIWMWSGRLTWLRVLGCQLPVTAGLIVADMLSPNYHGIFANRLNPKLDDYMKGRNL